MKFAPKARKIEAFGGYGGNFALAGGNFRSQPGGKFSAEIKKTMPQSWHTIHRMTAAQVK